MTVNPAKGESANHIYRAIRAQVIESDHGGRFRPGAIAARMGVSSTAVREALNRLVIEGLVVRAGRRGFIAMTMSETDVFALYTLTNTSLGNGLRTLTPPAQRSMYTSAPIATALNELRRIEVVDYASIAKWTGEIFSSIATLSKDKKVIRSINVTNDRLVHVRILECKHVSDVRRELVRFCELLLAGQPDPLAVAINTYHERRARLLPHLIESSLR